MDDAPVPHPEEWIVRRLGDVTLKIGSGATPRGGEESYLSQRERFALVRSQNVFDRRFEVDGLAFISDEQAERLKGVILQPGDLLLNITGDGITFARSCVVPREILPACVNQHVSIVRVDPTLADPGYVLAYLTHPKVKSYIESFNAGGSRRAITKGHIESFRLALPPLRQQRAIARALDTLDEKIELNRRMNETLEGIARGLFKSWFVDFDPVRAKAEGRDPGLPKRLADLFTDSFQESQLGSIPKGWVAGSFADSVEVFGGGTPKTSSREYWSGDIPWFSVVDSPRDSDVWVVDTEKKITQAGVENSSTRILPVGTVIVTARGTVGRVALVGVPMAMNQSCYGLRGKVGKHGYFTYFSTRQIVDSLRQHVHGSVFDTITRDTIAGVVAVAPPAVVADAFDDNLRAAVDRIRANLLESRTLTALRDVLLPQLISGELRMSAAEARVGEQT